MIVKDSRVDRIELASTYRLTAISFRLSAESLEKAFNDRHESMPRNYCATPYYFLILHSTELLLKSALLKHGVTPEELRSSRIRHNLLVLTERLGSYGTQISISSKRLIESLRRQHEKHDLRYTALLNDGELTYTPQPTKVYDMLDELLLSTR